MSEEAKSIIRDLAAWSSALKYEDIPERVLHKARLQMLSVLGAIHGTYNAGVAQSLIAGVRDWAGPGSCTILPQGIKADLLSALFCNAAMSMALDFDDYLLFGHTGHSAVLTPLMIAEKNGCTFRDVLTAQVIANELSGRIGASVVMGPHNGQTWSHIHLIGSAGAAARLLGLDAERTAQAMAVSMYQPNYVMLPGFMGPDSKLLTAATPMVTGVQAAFLAGHGFTGALDVMENRQGFLKQFSFYPLPFMLTGLGRAWVTDTLAFKIYPGCAYIDTTVDAVLAIRDEYRDKNGKDLDPGEVEGVLVEATALTVEMDQLSKVGESFDPLNPVSINFSIPGNVAIALLKGRLGPLELSPPALKEQAAAILPLAGRVRLRHDVQLSAILVAGMNSTLHLRDIARQINIVQFLRARSRLQAHYGRSMGLGFDELRDLYKQTTPEVRDRVWKQLRKSVGQRIAGISAGDKAGQAGYDLGDADLEHFIMPFAARVTIRLKNGQSLTHLQAVPIGGPGRPAEETKARVINKFTDQAAAGLGRAGADRVVEMVMSFDGHERAADIMGSCVFTA